MIHHVDPREALPFLRLAIQIRSGMTVLTAEYTRVNLDEANQMITRKRHDWTERVLHYVEKVSVQKATRQDGSEYIDDITIEVAQLDEISTAPHPFINDGPAVCHSCLLAMDRCTCVARSQMWPKTQEILEAFILPQIRYVGWDYDE